MITVKSIPKVEWDLLGKGIKYPDNEEWYDRNGEILETAIDIWKEAGEKKRKRWKERNPREFYDEVDPGLSDDGWDYIGPHYTYMPMESVIRTDPKFFGPTVKRFIVESIWDPTDDRRDDFSWEARDAWDAAISGNLKDNYKSGHVSRQFAEVMKPYENDDEAWEAIEIFYEAD